MKKQYKAVIFDLDGTLLDTLDDLMDATNFALRSMGFAERTKDEIRRFVGNGVRKLIERAIPIGSDEKTAEDTLAIFKSRYAEHCEDTTRPYDGILPLLDHLRERGMLLAVASNKIDSAVVPLCKSYFGDRFTFAIGERAGIGKKPAPDMIREVLCTLSLTERDVVYVGDSEVDVETAKNAGMDCISVTWGFRDIDVLRRAWGIPLGEGITDEDGCCIGDIRAYFANTPKDLENILMK